MEDSFSADKAGGDGVVMVVSVSPPSPLLLCDLVSRSHGWAQGFAEPCLKPLSLLLTPVLSSVLNLDKYRSPKTAGCSPTPASQIIAFFFFPD